MIRLVVFLLCGLTVASYGQQTGRVSGAVLDVNGGVVAGAQVTLTSQNPATSQTVLSDDAGEFSFSSLASGKFSVTVTARGLEQASANIVLQAGENLVLPEFRLAPAATTTDVEVSVTQTQIATEQLHAQEQQRVLGILPNFYSSYIWDAAPLNAGQKYQLALKSITDPITFLGTGIFAAGEQWQNTFSGYGSGAEGYAKRYGAAYADEALSRIIGSAILPSLLHQDPRYFYRGTGTKKTRALYAISQAVVCRGDNGKTQPNYSYVAGAFASGGLSNLYHPAGDRGIALTIGNGFLNVGAHAVDNLVREFLLRKLTPKVPAYAQGKP